MTAETTRILESLQARNDQAELWWDSLPSSFPAWREQLLAALPDERRVALDHQLKRFWEPSEATGLLRGCTSNPRLVLEGLRLAPEAWADVLGGLVEPNESHDPETLYWLLYREVYRRNARLLLPVWERSEGRHGWVCAQLLPSATFNVAALVAQGLALREAGPNVMIKVVGCEEGYQAIEQLTSLGIATNSTLSFSLSQAERCVEALRRGLAKARHDGVDLSRWRAVITYMMGRVGSEEVFHRQAEELGLVLDKQDVRWAETAVAGQLYRLLEAQEDPIKLLLCSLKVDPWPEETACHHLLKTVGMNCVYTLSPPFLQDLLGPERPLPLEGEGFQEAVPEAVLDRLMKIPYFRQLHEPGGLGPEEFHLQPAFRRGLEEVEAAERETLEWVRTRARKETVSG